MVVMMIMTQQLDKITPKDIRKIIRDIFTQQRKYPNTHPNLWSITDQGFLQINRVTIAHFEELQDPLKPLKINNCLYCMDHFCDYIAEHSPHNYQCCHCSDVPLNKMCETEQQCTIDHMVQ